MILKRQPKPKTISKKPKKLPLSRLKLKAWQTFSKWIRNRDQKCVSCGSTLPVEKLQAGHFFHGYLDFDEHNINAQCGQCNGYKHGNLAPYSIYLLNTIGSDGMLKLHERYITEKNEKPKHKSDYYLNIIKKYSIIS
jgi:hypothetical protein